MTEAEKRAEEEKRAQADLGDLSQGVVTAVTAAFEVGAVLARVFAQATAGSNPVPAPAANASPLNVIIHYGVTATTNVVSQVLSGLRLGTDNAAEEAGSAGSSGASTSAPPTTSGLPTVRRGSTLRIPLSIENPGSEPMLDMEFRCLSLKYLGDAAGRLLQTGAIRFEPAHLSVPPRDFEKLTVFIETEAQSALGLYEAQIGLASGSFETTLQFEVVAPT